MLTFVIYSDNIYSKEIKYFFKIVDKEVFYQNDGRYREKRQIKVLKAFYTADKRYHLWECGDLKPQRIAALKLHLRGKVYILLCFAIWVEPWSIMLHPIVFWGGAFSFFNKLPPHKHFYMNLLVRKEEWKWLK